MRVFFCLPSFLKIFHAGSITPYTEVRVRKRGIFCNSLARSGFSLRPGRFLQAQVGGAELACPPEAA